MKKHGVGIGVGLEMLKKHRFYNETQGLWGVRLTAVHGLKFKYY